VLAQELDLLKGDIVSELKKDLDALRKQIDRDREETAGDEAVSGVVTSFHKSWIEFTGAGE
jgi:hypothetical protein